MLSNLTTYFVKIITREKDQLLLWLPVCLLLGIILALSSPTHNIHNFFATFLLLAAIVLFYLSRFFYHSFIYIICGVILFGFLWASIYQQTVITNARITGKIYTDLEGQITHIKPFKSASTGKEGLILQLEKLTLYKADFSKSKKPPVTLPSQKPPKPKMIKKFLTLLEKCGPEIACIEGVKKASQEHEAAKKLRREQRKNKPKKLTHTHIEKNFLNLHDYQTIDRQFLSSQSNYQPVNWRKKGDNYLFPNPPPKVSLSTYESIATLAVGDVIVVRAIIEPPSHKEFIGGFDYALYSASHGIAGHGRTISDVTVLQATNTSSIHTFIAHLRDVISRNINLHLSGDNAAVADALMVGKRSAISQQTMDNIRQSGLAHLLAISGIHMAIAAFIFFSLTRFVLSRSEYVTLHFNIKKIAAIAAIVSAYIYLQLAGSPVPATRSFIMVTLVLMAVLIDRKTDLKRSIALAAFMLLLFNPYHVFSVSFQFSFSAILSLACFHVFTSHVKPASVSQSLIKKGLWYFTEIALASIVVQIATAPFLIYHFNTFPTYGLFANMFAIPLTTFITMPLGFLSMALMPFGLEHFPLRAMGISISYILHIAHVIASLPYAYFITPQMPKIAFACAVVAWLIMCLVKSHLKWCFALVFAASLASLFFVKKPNLLFDGDQKFFAIYTQQDGLIFSEKLRQSRKRSMWMEIMQETEFKFFDQYSPEWLAQRGIMCDAKKCEISTANGSILILKERLKIADICTKKHVSIVVNLNAKYALPDCFTENQTRINSSDFSRHGAYFMYFNAKEIAIKSAR